MRLKELHMTRYGHFTDKIIDFDEKKNDQPDIHILFGRNEAGKTTLFHAWLDLLFGIKEQTPYAFLHPYNTMQIGAVLDIEGQTTLSLNRIKARAHTLRNEKGAPLPDHTLVPHLYGLNRDAYQQMFSLNRNTLEQGGQNILASEGELGQLLFSASTGLAQLSLKIREIRIKNDAFFVPHSRKKSELKEYIQSIKHIKDEIKKLDMDAATFHKLLDEFKTAQETLKITQDDYEKVQEQLDLLFRKKSAYFHWQNWKSLKQQLEHFEVVPLPKEAEYWLPDILSLLREEVMLKERVSSAQRRLEEQKEQVELLPRDQEALHFYNQLSILEELFSRDKTAVLDLPKRLEKYAQEEEKIKISLKRFEKEDIEPSSLLLSEETTHSLNLLIDQFLTLEVSMGNALKEQERATDALALIEQKKREKAARSSPEFYKLTYRLLERIRNSSLKNRMVEIQRALRRAQDELSQALERLKPWQGTYEDFQSLSYPSLAKVQEWKRLWDNLQKREAHLQEKLEAQEVQREGLTARIHALKTIDGIISQKERLAIRARRNQAWQEHKSALTEETALFFETCLFHDDSVAQQEIYSAQSLVELAQTEKDLMVLSSALQLDKEKLVQCRKEKQELSFQIKQTVQAVLPQCSGGEELDMIEIWRNHADFVKKPAQFLKEVLIEQREFEEEQTELFSQVEHLFRQVGLKIPQFADWERVLAIGESFIEEERNSNLLQQRYEEACEEKQKRDHEAEEKQQAVIRWEKDWAFTLQGTWLAETSVSIEKMRFILKELIILERLIQDHTTLQERILAMQADRDRFSFEVQKLASYLEPSRQHLDIHDLWHLLKSRIQNAKVYDQDYQKALKRLEADQEKAQTSQEEWNTLTQRKETILLECQADSLEEARERIERWKEMRRLTREVHNVERQLKQELQIFDMHKADDLLSSQTQEQIEVSIQEFSQHKQNLFNALQTCNGNTRLAEHALRELGGDDAVVQANTRYQTLLLELQEKTEHYFKLAAGLMATEKALDHYRERHRSSMLKAASHAFHYMSQGAYQGLTTHLDASLKENLKAVAQQGGIKEVSELSDGTRAQLYLALRMAGYQEFADNRATIPFVADDILESFDNERAEATFLLLGKMAQKGQVIYLTHHKHLCDLAQKVLSGIQIHQL